MLNFVKSYIDRLSEILFTGEVEKDLQRINLLMTIVTPVVMVALVWWAAGFATVELMVGLWLVVGAAYYVRSKWGKRGDKTKVE